MGSSPIFGTTKYEAPCAFYFASMLYLVNVLSSRRRPISLACLSPSPLLTSFTLPPWLSFCALLAGALAGGALPRRGSLCAFPSKQDT